MPDLSILYSVLLVGLIFAFVGAVMARNRRVNIWVGITLGFFFGPLGFIGIALLSEAKPNRAVTKNIENPRKKSEGSLTIDQFKSWFIAAIFGLFGPLVFASYISHLLNGEFTSKHGVVSRSDNPDTFYFMSVFQGAIAFFLTVLSILFFFFFIRGRRST